MPKEVYWVAFFDSFENGYNMTPGGDGFQSGELHPNYRKVYTKAEKEHLSKAMKGNQNLLGHRHSEKTKEKMRKERKGKPNLKLRGKTRSEEHKKNISIAKTGKKIMPFTEEHKRKISEANKGRKRTEQEKLNISIATKKAMQKIDMKEIPKAHSNLPKGKNIIQSDQESD